MSSNANKVALVSGAAVKVGSVESYGLRKKIAPVVNCRKLTKKDMKLNDALPHIDVDSETYVVKADGQILTCDPMAVLPMAQRYFLF